MKKNILPIYLILLLFSCCKNQPSNQNKIESSVISFDSTSARSWTIHLLGTDTNLTSKWILWNPSKSDMEDLDALDNSTPEAFINPNKECHTLIDSTLFFASSGKQYLVQSINTYGMESDTEVMMCHPCAPVLGAVFYERQTNGKLLPIAQKKFMIQYGSMGWGGHVSIVKYDATKNAIKVESSWMGQGSIITTDFLFDAEKLNRIFEYTALESYEGFFTDEDSTAAFSYTCEPIFEKSGGETVIRLKRSGTKEDENYKIVNVDTEMIFHFNSAKNSFE